MELLPIVHLQPLSAPCLFTCSCASSTVFRLMRLLKVYLNPAGSAKRLILKQPLTSCCCLRICKRCIQCYTVLKHIELKALKALHDVFMKFITGQFSPFSSVITSPFFCSPFSHLSYPNPGIYSVGLSLTGL